MNIKRDYQKTVKEIYQEYHTSGKGLSSKEAKKRIKNGTIFFILDII